MSDFFFSQKVTASLYSIFAIGNKDIFSENESGFFFSEGEGKPSVAVLGKDFVYEDGRAVGGTATVAVALDDGDPVFQARLYNTTLGSFDGLTEKQQIAKIFSGNDYLSGNAFLATDDILLGGRGSDVISGGLGNDRINGGSGVDEMFGNAGNDIFYVYNRGDKVFEVKGEGIDLVKSSINYSLEGQDLEKLTLIGARSINGIGNELNNTISGNSGANNIRGEGGNDRIVGGLGRDVLHGGEGTDTFIFKSSADSGVGLANRDYIMDFKANIDKIDLHSIGGIQAFTFIGSDAFSHQAYEVHARASAGSTLVEGDIDGNGTADFQVVLKDMTDVLHAFDFVL